LQPKQIVSLNQLTTKKYATILCYPRYDEDEAMKRIQELKALDVEALEFSGEKRAFNVPVLGKGSAGLVVVALSKAGKAALKILRVDADRKGMQHEADMLIKANKIGVGPRFMNLSNNFLLMQFIEGELLPQWITHLKGKNAKKRAAKTLRDLLEQCWRMDQSGLDHGELSHAPKHVIVDAADNAHIVDFETASVLRRTSNVTAICQYLFMKSQLARMLRRKLGKVQDDVLITVLRTYKHDQSGQNFEEVLEVLRLAR